MLKANKDSPGLELIEAVVENGHSGLEPVSLVSWVSGWDWISCGVGVRQEYAVAGC